MATTVYEMKNCAAAFPRPARLSDLLCHGKSVNRNGIRALLTIGPHMSVFEKNAGPNHIISGPQYALLHTVNTCVMLLRTDFLELFSIML